MEFYKKFLRSVLLVKGTATGGTYPTFYRFLKVQKVQKELNVQSVLNILYIMDDVQFVLNVLDILTQCSVSMPVGAKFDQKFSAQEVCQLDEQVSCHLTPLVSCQCFKSE